VVVSQTAIRFLTLPYLAGVPGELYYVRDGQVNDYALGFTPPLHTNVTQLFFDWFDDSPATDSAPVNTLTDRLTGHKQTAYSQRVHMPFMSGSLEQRIEVESTIGCLMVILVIGYDFVFAGDFNINKKSQTNLNTAQP